MEWEPDLAQPTMHQARQAWNREPISLWIETLETYTTGQRMILRQRALTREGRVFTREKNVMQLTFKCAYNAVE